MSTLDLNTTFNVNQLEVKALVCQLLVPWSNVKPSCTFVSVAGSLEYYWTCCNGDNGSNGCAISKVRQGKCISTVFPL